MLSAQEPPFLEVRSFEMAPKLPGTASIPCHVHFLIPGIPQTFHSESLVTRAVARCGPETSEKGDTLSEIAVNRQIRSAGTIANRSKSWQ
jgi:hypothetical protein